MGKEKERLFSKPYTDNTDLFCPFLTYPASFAVVNTTVPEKAKNAALLLAR